MSAAQEAMEAYEKQVGWENLDPSAYSAFEMGWTLALEAARRVIAGEDEIEWARQATMSSIALAYAIEGIDALDPSRESSGPDHAEA